MDYGGRKSSKVYKKESAEMSFIVKYYNQTGGVKTGALFS